MDIKHLALAACLAIGSPIAFGDDAHHPDEKAKAGTAKAAPKAVPPKPVAPAAGMGPMHDNMKRMREEMAGIRAASDPKEKQRLMDEHLKTMESSMAMMEKMMAQRQKMHGSDK